MPTLPSTYQLDHTAIAVPHLTEAAEWYRVTTNATLSHHERLESQGVELVFVDTGSAKIELIAPLGPNSNLSKFLEKHGPGLHHVCFRVPDVQAELTRLAAGGAKLIDREPRPGAGGTRIAFVHPSSCFGTLLELCEYPGT